MDISKIKLVIWDLDNTFWRGTLTEGGCEQDPDTIRLVQELTLGGIVNSICSKNDFRDCQALLQQWGLWDYFVFPSIDWTPKGHRVSQIIHDMNLRPANVLFLDDEPSNLQAARLEAPELMCSTAAEAVPELLAQCGSLKKGPERSRLKRYQELQTKVETRREFKSDEEFLRLSHIKVSITQNCMPKFDRILELINRTNQLNFTKLRLDGEELQQLLSDPGFDCGYISCRDRFSDYGIVGFYALDRQRGALTHYLFSCRTIGMGVEQFVYAHLNYPQLKVTGNVVTELTENQKPDWITLDSQLGTSVEKSCTAKPKIIVKGPCDVSQVIPFFSGGADFCPEFAYTSKTKKGTYIEGHNHTSQIIQTLQHDAALQEKMVSAIPFIDEEFYSSTLFTEHYDYFLFSVLTDYSLGLYQSKEDPEIILPFGQYTSDYTQKENWTLVQGIFGEENVQQKKAQFERFCDSFVPIGRISDEQFLNNLSVIRAALPQDTVMIFLNGSERPYPKPCKERWRGREQIHAHMNRLLEQFVAEHSENCTIIDVNRCLGPDPMPYLDTINHYKKNVYYSIANSIRDFIRENNPQFQLSTSQTVRQTQEGLGTRVLQKLKRLFTDKK